MTLIEKIKVLCDEHGETFASLERKMDFGNGTLRRWGETIPSADKLARVADYFNTSVDYLLGRDSEPKVTGLSEIYCSFARDAQNNGIDPKDIQTVLDIIKRAKGENQ